jgi:hypothetical protein
MIIIKKNQINDWITCQQLFGKNILSNKYNNTPDDNKLSKFKSLIEQVASEEMKNMIKLPAADYRIRYTNTYFAKKSDYAFLAQEGIVRRLNSILSIFADNVFIGYNVPLEIPIVGTELIYRYMIDFLLVDHSGDVIAVEIEDLSDLDLFRQKMKNWPHYYAPYSFLTDVFKKDVFLVFIDPINYLKVEYKFTAASMSEDLRELRCVTFGITNPFYVKNLAQCNSCSYLGECQ